MVFRNAHRLCQLLMQHKLPVLAVNWHEEFRTYQIKHQLLLFLGGVSRDMHMRDGRVEHLRSQAEQVIDRAIHRALIARHRRRRKNNRITRLGAHEAMVAISDARQRGRWFALTARTDDRNLFRLELVDVLRANEHPLRHVQVAKLYRHLHVVQHTASNQCDMTIIAFGGIHNLLHTRDQRGKCCQQDTSRRVGENLVERLVNHALGWREAGRLNAGAITHHQQHAIVAKASQRAYIGSAPINRSEIKLVVASIQYRADGGMNHDTGSIGNTVVDVEKLRHTLAQCNLVARRDHS